MVDLVVSAGRLLVALVLVALNGFYVASEFAFVRIRETTVARLREEGRTGSKALSNAVDDLDDYLATTQLGITVASLGLGWAGEPAVAALVEPLLAGVVGENVVHLIAFAIGFSIITFLHVVFGELAPKTFAIQEPERIALLVAPPMRLSYYLFYPGIVVFNGAANFFTSLFGVEAASETDETLEEEELRRMLARAGQAGTVDAEEVDMVERVFDLDDTSVRAVMVPRPDVVTLSPDATLSEIRARIHESGHTRYPVVDEGDDEVVGFLDAKDVLAAVDDAEAAAETADPATEPTAGDLARDVVLVPETVRLDRLLARLQSEHRQMAVVIDEWGAFEGIATVEDVVEALVGDIRDDFDAARSEAAIQQLSDGSYAVDGSVPLGRLGTVLDREFDVGPVDTVAGLVLDRLGRVPEPGDAVTVDGLRFVVERVDDARIESVVVRTESETGERGDDGDETGAVDE